MCRLVTCLLCFCPLAFPLYAWGLGLCVRPGFWGVSPGWFLPSPCCVPACFALPLLYFPALPYTLGAVVGLQPSYVIDVTSAIFLVTSPGPNRAESIPALHPRQGTMQAPGFPAGQTWHVVRSACVRRMLTPTQWGHPSDFCYQMASTLLREHSTSLGAS